MAWLTHGKAPLGKCPLDARCMCELCWAELQRQGHAPPPGSAILLLTPATIYHVFMDYIAVCMEREPPLLPATTPPPILTAIVFYVAVAPTVQHGMVFALQPWCEAEMSWNCAGRPPAKTPSHIANLNHVSEPVSPISRASAGSQVASPAVSNADKLPLSPRSTGSMDVRGDVDSPADLTQLDSTRAPAVKQKSRLKRLLNMK
jgi:hypothetical protein